MVNGERFFVATIGWYGFRRNVVSTRRCDMSYEANETMNLMWSKFRGRILSRNSDVDWPPRSWYFTPLDLFFETTWKVIYRSIIGEQSTTVICCVAPQLWSDVIKNVGESVASCFASHGGHSAHIEEYGGYSSNEIENV